MPMAPALAKMFPFGNINPLLSHVRIAGMPKVEPSPTNTSVTP
jgi:hypothetical protein